MNLKGFEKTFTYTLLEVILGQVVPVAQWIARWTSNPEAAGSSPAGDDFFRFSSINFGLKKQT